jgi:uracil-DNA glycosylase
MDSLNALWKEVYELNKKHFPGNNLIPIVGNGKVRKPKFMFVFINPTVRNISSDPGWNGPRFPFVGTKQVWRIFQRAGFLDEVLMEKIEKGSWTVEFTKKILKHLQSRGIYITNIVKWTGVDAKLPDSKKVNLFLPLLRREIELVRPKYIITFGLIPFERLSGKKIRLGEYYAYATKNKKLKIYDTKIGHFTAKIVPCYFPVGRGNPKQAVEILKLVKNLVE